MFLMISWILTGAVLGSVGVAGIASAVARGGPRGDPNLDAIFFWLFVTTAVGAVAGGLLARMVRKKYAGDKRALDRFAILPLLGVAALVAYAALKP